MELLNRYRKYWITAGTLLVLLLCYQLAFKKTIAASQLYSRLSQQVTANDGLSLQPAFLERQYQTITALASSYHVDTANYRTQLLSKLAPLADSCHITLINIPKSNTSADGRITRQQIGAKGDFFSLLRFYALAEKQKGTGMASSVSWKKPDADNHTDKKAGEIELTMYFNGF
ncbi:hypothetical protein [Mucilaginibacter pedocola]|uniref:Uncharacterized protein n=1 Tax=Mucilaginibacter pedocola TaxID=1792845 RepID=A0A1S9PBG4_9SPHI|nr:hypothetical protein [Mucilaginibacter pedocola]OOQ58324.1 hypothetical protein BC343_11865 [Mucilaginibacter pedocola]